MVKSPIVARINALLAAKGIPKQQFYKDCSITSASYSLWNTGKTNPSMKNLKIIAEYLGVSVADLLPDEDLVPQEGIKKERPADGEAPDQDMLLEIVRDSQDMSFLLKVMDEVNKSIQKLQ